MATFAFSTEGKSTNIFEPIPPGKYPVEIVASELLQTKAGDGQYLKFTFSILDGEYAGRYIWSNINIDNPSPKAVEIAEHELASIIKACGLESIEETEELHGIPIMGRVKIKPAQGPYEASNTISGFKPIESGIDDSNEAPW